ncbi:YqeG family HAD IIIA-type phosphatase [Viridibacillus arvi]|uniref:YqeG family HAD IIIA-type phosphatase n=1 Tax=Viridibacillus arvi TaxID=263475 RepID=UPI00187B7ABA|nr:YqeG family HAD IIIA-type phosphatase [Viridibacillus sp. JNUCC-6]QOV12776.1 YqeG family HAD IIIA-type phosphatase [Viridibacillus sp. JNUCC-6]
MYNFLMPKEFVTSIYEITPDKLKQLGVRGIITDLDNTLVEWDRPDATEKLIEWLKTIREAGIQVMIVSNNKELRVKAFADPLELPYIFNARKPMGNAFKRALKRLNMQRHEVVMVGDQMLTDVLGGNRLRIHTILVKPVALSDGFVTRFNRMVERRVFNYLKKHGVKTWEE